MAKSKYIYTCNQCGFESTKWNGKCPSCGAWNSFEEELADVPAAGGRSASSQGAAPDLSDSILELEAIGTDNDVRSLPYEKAFPMPSATRLSSIHTVKVVEYGARAMR